MAELKNTRLVVLLTFGIFLQGCSSSLAYMMKISIWEFFEINCPSGSVQCELDIENHLDECFDNDIAKQTIKSRDPIEKCRSNEKLITTFERCLEVKVGNNYWEDIDLPATFYEQLNAKRKSEGKSSYPFPCDSK